jgi:copper chaperone CopZ
MLIEGELIDIGVEAACNYAGGYVDVVFDEKRILETDIVQAITKLGYGVRGNKNT